jgi:hypothetical protein
MNEQSAQPDAFFFAHRGERGDATGALAEALAAYQPAQETHPYWSDSAPQSLLIDEVEAIWDAIAQGDDWGPLHAKVTALRRMGAAHGPAPQPAGHAA